MFSSLGLALLLSSAAHAAVYDIEVGSQDGQLKFVPEAIGANVGDQVVFHFNPKNHSVVQSSFASPCGPKEGGIRSEFFPVAANVSMESRPTWTITINDTEPFWAYCSQAGNTPNSHCGAGMVFAVNCGPDGAPNSFGNFKNSALEVGKQLKTQEESGSGYGDSGYGDSGYGGGDKTWTAAYGGYTVPPAEDPVLVTQTVTLDDQVWTTTYESYPGSAEPTPASAEGNVIKVIVGGPDGTVFSPPSIQASPRDTVVFELHAKNHSVTQSTFADPCRKMAGGFDSELMPVADENGPFPTFNITVEDTKPIWAYCKQKTPGSHCGGGMVFAINAVEDSARNFAAFQDLAKQMNGTAAAAIASPSDSAEGSGNNAASSVKVHAGLTIALVAAIASLL